MNAEQSSLLSLRSRVPRCGSDSTLIETYDASAGGEQFYVRCNCGYETPERTSEEEAWADHASHAWPEESRV